MTPESAHRVPLGFQIRAARVRFLPVSLGLVTVSGCGYQWHEADDSTAYPAPDVRVCSEVLEVHEPLTRAVDDWHRALRNWRAVYLATDGCDAVVIRGECETPTAIACTTSLGGRTIHVQHPLSRGLERAQLAHEIGHMFGAQHVPDSLMSSPADPRWECPDSATVAQVAAFHRVPIGLFGWCWR